MAIVQSYPVRRIRSGDNAADLTAGYVDTDIFIDRQRYIGGKSQERVLIAVDRASAPNVADGAVLHIHVDAVAVCLQRISFIIISQADTALALTAAVDVSDVGVAADRDLRAAAGRTFAAAEDIVPVTAGDNDVCVNKRSAVCIIQMRVLGTAVDSPLSAALSRDTFADDELISAGINVLFGTETDDTEFQIQMVELECTVRSDIIF